MLFHNKAVLVPPGIADQVWMDEKRVSGGLSKWWMIRMTTGDRRTPRPALRKEILRVGGASVGNHAGGLWVFIGVIEISFLLPNNMGLQVGYIVLLFRWRNN